MDGNWNKILFVNLTDSDIWEEELSNEIWSQNIGGIGLGMYLFERTTKYETPYSSFNPLVISAGPLTGTEFPNTGRHSIVSRSPLTGILGESNSGGYFGAEMKRAGYDALVIVGKAPSPSILKLNDSPVIEERLDLWGKDFFTVEEKLKNGSGSSVMGIGRGGENLSPISAVINDRGRVAGHSGLGGVFGSKNLKAIVVNRKKEIPIFDRERFKDFSNITVKKLLEHNSFKNEGANNKSGTNPLKENDLQSSAGWDRSHLSSAKKYNCASCVTGCSSILGENENDNIGPEPRTIAAFLPFAQRGDFSQIVKWNYELNKDGFDTLSVAALLKSIGFGKNMDSSSPVTDRVDINEQMTTVDEVIRNLTSPGDSDITSFIGKFQSDLLRQNREKPAAERSLGKAGGFEDIQNSAIICKYGRVSREELATAISLATGIQYSTYTLSDSASIISSRRNKINENLRSKVDFR